VPNPADTVLDGIGHIKAFQGDQGADPHISVVLPYIIQIGYALDIDHNRRAFNAVLHIYQQIRPAGENSGLRFILQNRNGLIYRFGLIIFKFW